MPLLEEVLDLVAGRVPIIVELKDQRNSSRNKRLCELVDEALQNYNGITTVQSFNPFLMRTFASIPGALDRYLCGQLGCVISKDYLPNPFSRLFVAHFLGTHLSRTHYIACRSGEYEKSLACLIMRVWPKTPRIMWTINTLDEYNKYRDEGVDAIIFEGFNPVTTKAS